MARDCMEEFGDNGGVEVARLLLDHPQAEVDVSEQATFLRLTKRGAASKLSDAADVVEERGGEQEIVSEARVKLRSLTTQGRDADRVLEQPSRVAVMPIGAGCWKRPQGAPNLRVADERVDHGGKPFVSDLSRD